MKTIFKAVFIDTNILIYQTFNDFEPEKNCISEKLLNNLYTKKNLLIISPQILREFFSIATNQTFFKNPLSPKKAILKINEFIEIFELVYESENTISILKDLILKYNIKRKNIHDTNITATMIDNNISHLLTFNINDFKKFDEIQLINIFRK